MVTFTGSDSHKELDRKFKVNKSDKHTVVLPRDEYEEHTEYRCNCGSVLEVDKTQGAGWCNQCVSWIQLKDSKKEIAFEIPQSTQTASHDIISIDNDFYNQVKVDNTPQPRGALARMQEKGLRITSYTETDGSGAPITTRRRRYDDDE